MMSIAITLHLAKVMFAAFEYRQAAPASLFPMQSAVCDHAMVESISNPAYLPMTGSPYASFSGAKPYSLAELNAHTTSAGFSWGMAGAEASWSRFGIDVYREDLYQAGFGLRPFKALSIGAGASFYSLSISNGDLDRHDGIWEGSCSLLVMPAEWIHLSFMEENLVSLIAKRKDPVYPSWSAGAIVSPVRGLAFMYNLNRGPFGPTNTVSLSAKILPFMALLIGYQRETTSYAAALSIAWRHLMVSYGIRYHSYLGMTHSVGVTASLSERRFESMRFGSSRGEEPSPAKKININTATEAELRSIPVLSEGMLERIVKYREAIGPLSRKGLFQIGMSGRDIDVLLEYSYGLKDPRDMPRGRDEKSGKAKRNKSFQERRDLFARLVHAGVRAMDAMRLSELAAAGKRKELAKAVDSLAGIGDSDRKKIRDLCAGRPY